MKYRKQCNCKADLKAENIKIESDVFSHKITASEETKWRCSNCGKLAVKREEI